tara:strand:- start:1206 stop:2471 length:1266 start_codon:yes stop_codon:yes gene_type:complete
MNLAVIGSGGREHAICFKLHKSKRLKKLICIPGNPGTGKIAKNINVDISNFDKVYKVIKENDIDIVVIGPEQPLVDGIVDYLEERLIKVIGPNKFASQLEGSKAFMKNLCKKNNIPTAKYGVFTNLKEAEGFISENGAPIVVKADGLAAGKGVSICKNVDEAKIKTKEILDGKFKSSRKVILEEFLEGEELSYFILADKNSYSFFGSAQDHKKVGEGDTGPNTGGMGAYSPAQNLDKNLENKIIKKIIEPTLLSMKAQGNPYRGFLYAGLMICNGDPYLIEYNIRMGDPECQVIMMRLKNDLVEIFDMVTKNKTSQLKISWENNTCMTIVLCSNGYPGKYKKNKEINNLELIKEDKNNQIFHAGTYEKDKRVFSNGGRVLNFTSSSENLFDAREMILLNLKELNWKDGFYRKDIGRKAIKK